MKFEDFISFCRKKYTRLLTGYNAVLEFFDKPINLDKFIRAKYGKNIYLSESKYQFKKKSDDFSDQDKQLQVLKSLKLDGSLAALILVNSAGAGMGFLIAKGYFDVVPNSLVESARLDGCSNFQIFYKIILPLSKDFSNFSSLFFTLSNIVCISFS